MTTFFFLLFLLSWIGAIPMVLSSYGISFPAPIKLLQVLMFFGAGIAAVFCSWKEGGWNEVRRLLKSLTIWRVKPWLYFAVLAWPSFIFLSALILSNQTGATSIPYPDLQKFITGFGSTFLVYFFLNTEEIAWRGFALSRLQSKYGPMKASGVIGILWMLFHLPLFFMKGGHPAGYPFWLFALMILAWTIPFTSLYNASGGSVLLTHMLHQSMNAGVEAIPIYPVITKSLVPMCFVTGVSVLITIALIWRQSGLSVARQRPPVLNAGAP